jgi:hypothetical protein
MNMSWRGPVNPVNIQDGDVSIPTEMTWNL